MKKNTKLTKTLYQDMDGDYELRGALDCGYLCKKMLRRYFKIPKNTPAIKVVISDKSFESSRIIYLKDRKHDLNNPYHYDSTVKYSLSSKRPRGMLSIGIGSLLRDRFNLTAGILYTLHFTIEEQLG